MREKTKSESADTDSLFETITFCGKYQIIDKTIVIFILIIPLAKSIKLMVNPIILAIKLNIANGS